MNAPHSYGLIGWSLSPLSLHHWIRNGGGRPRSCSSRSVPLILLARRQLAYDNRHADMPRAGATKSEIDQDLFVGRLSHSDHTYRWRVGPASMIGRVHVSRALPSNGWLKRVAVAHDGDGRPQVPVTTHIGFTRSMSLSRSLIGLPDERSRPRNHSPVTVSGSTATRSLVREPIGR